MISLRSSELDPGNGLVGRQFVISGEHFNREVFFCIPSRFRDLLSRRDDVILPYLGLFGLVHGQDINIDGLRVDPEFLRNVRCGLNELAKQHGGMRVPAMSGSVPDNSTVTEGDAASVFFSGGIDSFFSLLRLRDQIAQASNTYGSVGYAVHIYHTKELVEPRAFETLNKLSETAEAFGMELIPVQSNFMEVDKLVHGRWADLGHGAGLATVQHLLSAKIKVGIIGSTHRWGGLMPWGSSPIIDPLWSSQRMKIIHDDARYGRAEKTELVSRFPDALSSLNVCDNRIDGSGYVNCSHCPKCLRTMVTLDLLGFRGNQQVPCFDWSDYYPEAFSRVFLRTINDAEFAIEIRELAKERGREDIMAACNTALHRGRSFRLLSSTENFVKNTKIGRKYRDSLVQTRTRLYRSMGWVTKPK